MIRLLDLQKQFILNHLSEGDTAVDFTMGNGHDTAFLSQTVGETGHVFAFDIQESALKSTEKTLTDSNCPKNYTLICDSHHNVKNYVSKKIKAGMFNLGWLPGGDRSITTLRATTLPAIEAAVSLLDSDAILTVAVYPGHSEGDAEGKMVNEYLASLNKYAYSVAKIKIINSPTSPFFFAIETK